MKPVKNTNLLALLVLLVFASFASAVALGQCLTLGVAGQLYSLNQSVSSVGTCFNVTAENVTLDCAGYGINFSSATQGYGVASNSSNTTVQNCAFINNTNASNVESYPFGAFKGVTVNAVNSSFNKSWALSAGSELPDYGASWNGVNMTGNVLLYHLNEANDTIVDYSGAGNNGTNTGATYGVSGVLNTTALSFNGEHNRILAKSGAIIVGASEGTIEAWVATNSIVDGTQKTVYSENIAVGTVFQIRRINNTLDFSLSQSNGNWQVLTASSTIAANQWYHVAATFNVASKTMKIYVDGDLKGTLTSWDGTFKTPIVTALVGDIGNVGLYSWNGSIDEFAVWNRTLSGAEVAHVYEVQKESHYDNDALNVSWYADVHTTTDAGADLGSVNVNVSNVNGSSIVNLTSNATGWSLSNVIQEYFQNASGIYNFTPHGFNATKTDYAYNNSNYSIDASKTLTIALTALTAAGYVEAWTTAPLNNTLATVNATSFLIACNTTNAPDTLILLSNFTGSWAVNYTNSSYVNATLDNYTVNLTDGTYLWAVWCNDSTSNFTVTNNYTLNVNTTIPPAPIVFPKACEFFGTRSTIRAFANANQDVNAVEALLAFGSETVDLRNEFNTATGVFTPSKEGYYNFKLNVLWFNFTDAAELTLSLKVNGTALSDNIIGVWNTTRWTQTFSDTVYLAANSNASFYVNTTNATTVFAGARYSYLTITKAFSCLLPIILPD